MSQSHKQPPSTKREYIVHPKDLPLSCPTDAMEIWNAHPKVYLPIEKTGEVVCPYCSAHFILKND
ncbi:zinc-finger domain-containing protein [Legionella gresilensis]|uniref:zinc-finger domain-containing protein n=1 Tax=Legionella gresilensis TaxID=91823 RepID=UPI001041A20C|nr:zinc-finger domain-containing protein [Legionella gresilensis]